jgi:hypothetical protein
MRIWMAKFQKDKTRDGTRFRAGILLIIISFPVSACSAIVGTYMSRSASAWFALVAGVTVYAFSWVLFLMGIWLAEKKGLRMAKELWTLIRHGRKKLENQSDD